MVHSLVVIISDVWLEKNQQKIYIEQSAGPPANWLPIYDIQSICIYNPIPSANCRCLFYNSPARISQIECTHVLFSMTNGCHNYRLIPPPYAAQNLHNINRIPQLSPCNFVSLI